jgi:hypothetical protein
VRPVEQYRVFGRTSYPEPLTAADDDAAARAALERHGPRWVELVLIPERAIRWILGPQAPVPSPEGSTDG